tara:strand:+ start:464 stop:1282 length:819 start_codon:yes stop_codon:yes gene_type:complete
MAQENIKLTKKIYKADEGSDSLNNSFSELFQSSTRQEDINQFFKLYEDIFYNMPKEGGQSHSTLIIESSNYVENFLDPKDEQIDRLLDRLLEAEEQLIEITEAEHPIFRNGTFIRTPNRTIYFIQQGRARQISNMQLYTTIATAQGLNVEDEPFTEVAATTPSEIGYGLAIQSESDIANSEYIVRASITNFLELTTSLRNAKVNANELEELRQIVNNLETHTPLENIEVTQNRTNMERDNNGNRPEQNNNSTSPVGGNPSGPSGTINLNVSY